MGHHFGSAFMDEATWNPSNLQDRALISRSQEGDHSAFEALVHKYQHQLLTLVCWHAGPAADTDDILQLILCKVYFSLKSFDLDRPFYPWLRRIAVNRCCDERRRLRRRKALTFAELELEESRLETERPLHAIPYAEINQQEMSDMLQRVIKMLPAEYQEVIILHHLQQMPYEEISTILKCSPRAARVKACRARAALRRLLLGSSSVETTYITSPNLMQRLDACCRRNQPKRPRAVQASNIRGFMPYAQIREAHA
jgi:RNA polymerase sigma-70 factor, ECF subfamily